MGAKDDVKGSEKKKSPRKRSGTAKALTTFAPQCIYFYYLEPKDTHHANVRAFLHGSTQTLTDGLIDNTLVPSFLSQVASGTYTDIIPIGHFFEDVTWVRQSYLVIMVKQPYKITNIDIWDSTDTLKNKKMLTINGVHGVRYRNYVTRKGGQTWHKDKREKEALWLEIAFKSTLRSSRIQMATHDDSGTNLGPPLPPP